MKTFTLTTSSHEELIDITKNVQTIVRDAGIKNGICTIYTPHTTAALTINENADPHVISDILLGLYSLNFEKLPFRHSEGNSPAHLKSSMLGCSAQVIIDAGKPVLGTWQGIYFCEFDGPRTRKVFVHITE